MLKLVSVSGKRQTLFFLLCAKFPNEWVNKMDVMDTQDFTSKIWIDDEVFAGRDLLYYNNPLTGPSVW